jgi:hypothetical protein
MKIVFLIDGSKSNYEKMVRELQRENKDAVLINTEHCDEEHEYKYLMSAIESFSNSGKDVMLAKFSGRESIARDLGDIRSEMIIPISYNTNNNYYNRSPMGTFLDLLKTFELAT